MGILLICGQKRRDVGAGATGQAVAGGSIRARPGRCQPTVWLEGIQRARSRRAGWLLPARCILCAGAGRGAGTRPLRGLRGGSAVAAVACPRCGLPVDDPMLQGTTRRLRALPRPAHCLTDGATRGFRYEFPLSELVHGAQVRGRARQRARARHAARRQPGAATGCIARSTLLVPMPLHTSRLVERGFNQSLEIARFTAAALRHGTRRHVALHRRRDDRAAGRAGPRGPRRTTCAARLPRIHRAEVAGRASRCSTTS